MERGTALDQLQTMTKVMKFMNNRPLAEKEATPQRSPRKSIQFRGALSIMKKLSIGLNKNVTKAFSNVYEDEK